MPDNQEQKFYRRLQGWLAVIASILLVFLIVYVGDYRYPFKVESRLRLVYNLADGQSSGTLVDGYTFKAKVKFVVSLYNSGIDPLIIRRVEFKTDCFKMYDCNFDNLANEKIEQEPAAFVIPPKEVRLVTLEKSFERNIKSSYDDAKKQGLKSGGVDLGFIVYKIVDINGNQIEANTGPYLFFVNDGETHSMNQVNGLRPAILINQDKIGSRINVQDYSALDKLARRFD